MDTNSISISIPWNSIPLGSIVTGIFTLTGILIANYFNEKRWYLDSLLKYKADRILHLHSILVGCFYRINYHINNPPQDIEEYRDLCRTINDFLKEVALTEPYLDTSGKKIICNVKSLFQIAEREILLNSSDNIRSQNLIAESYKELDYEKLINSFHDACGYLENIANPPPLKKFERRILRSRD